MHFHIDMITHGTALMNLSAALAGESRHRFLIMDTTSLPSFAVIIPTRVLEFLGAIEVFYADLNGCVDDKH